MQTNKLTNKPVANVIAAIQALNLESVKIRLMDPELGEGWSREYADSIESAYKTYLTMLAKYQEHAEEIMLAKDVDEFWHTHILQTMKYAQDCEKVFGAFLHHNPHVGPRTTADMQSREAMAKKTQDLYAREFGGAVHKAWSGSADVPSHPAYSSAAIAPATSAYSSAAIRSQSAAYSSAAIEHAQAAYSSAAIRAENSAYSSVAIKHDQAAYSSAAVRADKAAYSSAAIQQAQAAYSSAAIRPENSAYSSVAIKHDQAAYSSASIRAQDTAYSSAAVRPQNAAYSSASVKA